VGSYADIPGWTCSEIERLYREEAERLAQIFVPRTVVEVGVAYGRSLAYLAERCTPNVTIYGVDVWTEHMGGDNLPREVFARLKAHGTPEQACIAELTAAGVIDRVKLLNIGRDAAKMFEDDSVDMIFIDACHEYDEVLADILAWLPKVRPGGILAGHDYSFEMFPGVVKAVQKVFAFGEEAREISVRGVVWRIVK
jgi:predicted O-methyltransferase YrrM